MPRYKTHHFKRDGIPVKRYNAIIPVSYFNRLFALAQDMEITSGALLMKFIDRFDDIKRDNE